MILCENLNLVYYRFRMIFKPVFEIKSVKNVEVEKCKGIFESFLNNVL